MSFHLTPDFIGREVYDYNARATQGLNLTQIK